MGDPVPWIGIGTLDVLSTPCWVRFAHTTRKTVGQLCSVSSSEALKWRSGGGTKNGSCICPSTQLTFIERDQLMDPVPWVGIDLALYPALYLILCNARFRSQNQGGLPCSLRAELTVAAVRQRRHSNIYLFIHRFRYYTFRCILLIGTTSPFFCCFDKLFLQ